MLLDESILPADDSITSGNSSNSRSCNQIILCLELTDLLVLVCVHKFIILFLTLYAFALNLTYNELILRYTQNSRQIRYIFL